ncbi:MAG: hypothetical protein GY789_16025 [Hyphomicrobiales bacterium]|nr:hypothetical protein [Hyphomicrobiales bacterium]
MAAQTLAILIRPADQSLQNIFFSKNGAAGFGWHLILFANAACLELPQFRQHVNPIRTVIIEQLVHARLPGPFPQKGVCYEKRLHKDGRSHHKDRLDPVGHAKRSSAAASGATLPDRV